MSGFDAATVHTPEFWDERYAEREPVWSGRPNVRLVEQCADLEPGEALELGCGEGGDAAWLAARGWTVTATDVSAVAVAKAEQLVRASVPAEVSARITWLAADMRTWQPERQVDLVTMHYVHPHRDSLPDLYARLAATLRPGGMLLVVNHDPLDLQTTMHRHDMPGMLLRADELTAAADPEVWDVVVAEAFPRVHDHDGEAITLHDTVVRLRRRRPPTG